MGDTGIKWRKVWERKAKSISASVTLANLLAADGFDTGTGIFPVNSWLEFVSRIMRRFNLKSGDRVLEVGCGAGAFLFPLYTRGIDVYGVDYSDNQIALCRRVMKGGIFKVGEANKLPFNDGSFDVVISNSVFQYFPDLKYAEEVVTEMDRVTKSRGCIGIFDVNDIEKKEGFIKTRKEKLGEKEYERLYGDLEHMFYSRAWFRRIAMRYGFECEIEDQSIEGYLNSFFRYNVFFKKKF